MNESTDFPSDPFKSAVFQCCVKEKINRTPDPDLYKQSADKADEVIDDLDIEFMPAVKEKSSRSKEQQLTKKSQKSKPRRKKGPEMAL